jgi:hypothetical protein
MAAYQPLYIKAYETGLVQNREEFILPDDAYPVLQNAYIFRERILRKKGFSLLGRLQRSATVSTSLTAGAVNLITALSLGSTASIVPGSINIVGTTDGTTYTDPSKNGVLTATGGTGTGGSVNYSTGLLTINAGGAEALTGTIQYYPGLPVMGIRVEELANSANDRTIFFDQKYAYIFNSGTSQFQEFIPGTTWNAAGLPISGIDFFWSTNYWVSGTPNSPFGTSNAKLFWVTNNSGHSGANSDPPRITDGTTWVDFFPSAWSQIDATNFLTNWLCNLPFRGRMVTFNTWEGPNATSSLNHSNRIRWSTIGNPFIAYAAGPPATGSWRSDIRGQGGFLDIPTSEDIISVGFVRDNLVIYCERSTWQLRYTGRSISPFQIEKVNSELGAESTFSTVQFDTSLVGIGDKGIVECDSYKSDRIDIKIPDFVFQFNSLNNGVARVQGIRDFPNRLAYWTVTLAGSYDAHVPSTSWIFPNIRLVYNYENDSWALFNDSLTTLGNYQEQTSRTWINTDIPWIECDFSWINQPQSDPQILGGNQQGFVEILNNQTVNDPSLYISNITQGSTVTITSPNHNMMSGFVVGISGIPATTPFSSLNGGIYGINVTDANNFTIFSYNSVTDLFDLNVVATPSGTYVGSGLINIRENFTIQSKKFNFIDDGQSIQMGYLDILTSSQESPGSFSLNVFLDYDDLTSSNTKPQNQIDNGDPNAPADGFFNAVIPMSKSDLNGVGGTKYWQRVFCPTRANFLTLQYKFNNAQMASESQQLKIQIDAQTLWLRRGGRLTQI